MCGFEEGNNPINRNFNRVRYIFGLYKLENIVVDAENKNYISEDGILFDKDKTELIQYPAAKAGVSYTVPSTVSKIDGCAFKYTQNVKTINVPQQTTSIAAGAFSNSVNLEDHKTLMKTTVITVQRTECCLIKVKH